MKITDDRICDILLSHGFINIDFTQKDKIEKIIFQDKDGYIYVANEKTILYNVSNFSFQKFGIKNPFTIQNAENWCKINSKFKIISKEYNGPRSKLEWLCSECNQIFKSTLSDIINEGYGCASCSGKQVNSYNSLYHNREDLMKFWNYERNNVDPKNITIYNNSKVWWKCEYGHEWQSKISNRAISKNQCPICNNILPSEKYNLELIFPDLIKEWDYQKNIFDPSEYTPFSNKKVYWICNKCGHSWEASPCYRLGHGGVGCPKCRESKGEKKIREILIKNNIYFLPQYKNINCKNKRKLPFDFAIFLDKNCMDLFCLLEYDGIFHYENKFKNDDTFYLTKQNDKIKNEFCEKNNINLIRIPYMEFENIEKIIFEKIISKIK